MLAAKMADGGGDRMVEVLLMCPERFLEYLLAVSNVKEGAEVQRERGAEQPGYRGEPVQERDQCRPVAAGDLQLFEICADEPEEALLSSEVEMPPPEWGGRGAVEPVCLQRLGRKSVGVGAVGVEPLAQSFEHLSQHAGASAAGLANDDFEPRSAAGRGNSVCRFDDEVDRPPMTLPDKRAIIEDGEPVHATPIVPFMPPSVTAVKVRSLRLLGRTYVRSHPWGHHPLGV